MTSRMSDDARGLTAVCVQGSGTEVELLRATLPACGVRVAVTTDPRQAVTLATSERPKVVLLDAALAGLDVAGVTRVLARHPDTATAAILAVVAEDATPREIERIEAAGVFAVVRRPLDERAVRGAFAKAIAHTRDAAGRGRSPGRRGSRVVAGCEALLRRELRCPFHSFGVTVPFFQLRVGRVAAEADYFDVPVYGPAVDYNVAGVAVCPECFFATSDPGYLDDPDDAAGLKAGGDDAVGRAAHRIDPATRAKVTQGAGLRGLLAHDRLGGEPGRGLFGHDRSPVEADVAHALAVASCRALHEAAPVRRSAELLRAGNHELRRANLTGDPATATRRRRSAAEWLGRAFAACRGTAMHRAAYQLVALHVHLGDDAAALPYLSALKEQSRLSRRDQGDPAALARYERRAGEVWADRERHRAPVLPVAGLRRAG